MAAPVVSRMVRRVLRSSIRSCNSGAPVTQPRPGDPSQSAAEVSLPASRERMAWQADSDSERSTQGRLRLPLLGGTPGRLIGGERGVE